MCSMTLLISLVRTSELTMYGISSDAGKVAGGAKRRAYPVIAGSSDPMPVLFGIMPCFVLTLSHIWSRPVEILMQESGTTLWLSQCEFYCWLVSCPYLMREGEVISDLLALVATIVVFAKFE